MSSIQRSGKYYQWGAVIWVSAWIALLVWVLVLMTGCASDQVPPSKLERPAAFLMVAPAVVPEIAVGEDTGLYSLRLRRAYSKEAGKLTRLQRYIRTILKK